MKRRKRLRLFFDLIIQGSPLMISDVVAFCRITGVSAKINIYLRTNRYIKKWVNTFLYLFTFKYLISNYLSVNLTEKVLSCVNPANVNP